MPETQFAVTDIPDKASDQNNQHGGKPMLTTCATLNAMKFLAMLRSFARCPLVGVILATLS